MTQSIGIIVISHGSPRAEANQGFTALVERLASRLEGAQVLPAFFSIARPDIADQVSVLAGRGLSLPAAALFSLFRTACHRRYSRSVGGLPASFSAGRAGVAANAGERSRPGGRAGGTVDAAARGGAGFAQGRTGHRAAQL